MLGGEFSLSKAFGSEDFLQNIQKDVKSIQDYTSAVDQGTRKTIAWDAWMSKASATAQQFVKDNQDGLDDINRLSFLYAHETRKSQFGKSLEDSFTGAVNAIRLYNEGTKKAELTTDEFHEVVAKVNPELDAYIAAMEGKGKKPTAWGYIWQTKKATIQTGLFTAGISLGTAALGLFAQKGNTTAAQVVGGLTAVGGAIAGVVSAIQLAKGALSLTTGFGIISAGISAVIAGINAYQTASARMREAWQADIDQLEQFKQSSEELTEAYTNVSKYLTALQNGEDVSDAFEIFMSNASEEAQEYVDTLQETTDD